MAVKKEMGIYTKFKVSGLKYEVAIAIHSFKQSLLVKWTVWYVACLISVAASSLTAQWFKVELL